MSIYIHMEPQLGFLPCFYKKNSVKILLLQNSFLCSVSPFFFFCCHLSLATAAYYPSQKSPVLADNFLGHPPFSYAQHSLRREGGQRRSPCPNRITKEIDILVTVPCLSLSLMLMPSSVPSECKASRAFLPHDSKTPAHRLICGSAHANGSYL